MQNYLTFLLSLFRRENTVVYGKLTADITFFILLLMSLNAFSQTTVFSDDFNRASVSPGGAPSMTYVMTNTGGGSSSISSTPVSGTEPFLRIANGSPAGRSYVTGALSTFSTPFQTTLATNTGLITWSFNVRHNRNSTLGGFNSAAYGAAIVLVASDANLLAPGCNGYAIAQGGNSSNDYRLVRFTNGLGATANLTTLVSGLLPSDRRDYMSVKVTYDPLTGNWKLYERRDASFSATSPPALWQDASGLSEANLMGMFTDNTYTGVPMTSFGYLWNYSTSAGQYFYVDNFKVSSTPIIMPSIDVFPGSLSGFYYMVGSGPSAVQYFEISGSNLSGYPNDLMVTGSANYEVSNDNENFGAVAYYYFTEATLNPKPVYVRLKAGLPAGIYNSEIISCTGGGALPEQVICSGYVMSLPVTYTWTGQSNTDFQVASNWNPVRTNPIITDILQFNDGNTYTVTNVPTQTIGKLLVSNGTSATLQTSYSATLTISGDSGNDLLVSGTTSELNLSGATPITLSITSGSSAEIEGQMQFSQGAHRLIAADTSSVKFLEGSRFIANTGFTGNPFGTVNLNTIVFNTGSEYHQNAGSNPFGASQPNSVVRFMKGSLLKFTAPTGSPAFSGRTYADFEFDSPSNTQNPTGSYPLTCDNFIHTSGVINFNFTGSIILKGNLSVASGSMLTFGNLANPTILMIGGTETQTISGGGTLILGSNSTFMMNNEAGLILERNLSFQNLSLYLGLITTNGYTVTIGGNVEGGSAVTHINGRVSRQYTGNGTFTFPIGKNGNYRPVSVNMTYLNAPSLITAEQIESAMTGTLEYGTVIYPERYWTITQSGSTSFTYDITLDGTGFELGNSPRIIKKDGATLISYPASYSSPYYTVTNLNSFSDFAIGEYTPLPNLIVSGSLQAFNTTVGTPSLPKFYMVQGTNLSGGVLVTAPQHFEISDSESGTYGNTLSLTPYNGTLYLTPVYVRFNPTAGGVQTGNVTNQVSGFPVQNMAVTGTALVPAVSLSQDTLNGFTYVQGFGPSSSQFFVLEGVGLFGNIIINAPVHYQVSLSPSSGFVNSLSLTPQSGNTGPVSIYVRLKQGLLQAEYNNEQINIASLYSVPVQVYCNGNVTPPPVISTSVSALSGFSYITGFGPSNSKTFTVYGQYLVGNINVTAGLNYEVSLTQASGYSNSVSIIPVGGLVGTTTVYVRLKAGLLPGNYNNIQVSITSLGAVNKTVTCNGIVYNLPVISLNQYSLSGFTYIVGTGPSISQTLTVSAINLQNAVMISAPENYEVTTGSSTSYYPTIFLIPTAGTLAPTSVHIRLKAGLSVGDYNDELVSFTSMGALTKIVNCNGMVLAESVPTVAVSSIDGFGDVCVGNIAGPEEITVSGHTLTIEPVEIIAPPGFRISETIDGEFVSSLIIPQPGGVFNAIVYVQFYPLLAQVYSGDLLVSGGGAPIVTSWLEGNGVIIPPTIITSEVVGSITGNSAVCYGSVTDIGCNDVQSMGICYGVVTGPDTSGTKTVIPGGEGDFSSLLENLLPATVYYYRAYAISLSGITYGIEYQFTTLPILPVILTLEATEITGNTAVLNCQANANNSQTDLSFEYGIDLQYGYTLTASPDQVAGFDYTLAHAELDALEPNTLYHFRASAVNAAGTVNGEDLVFQTSTLPPFAQSTNVTDNCGTVARLHGIVRANNQDASVVFEYGPTEEYGFAVVASPEIITGNSAVDVFADITDLSINTVYHYRVVATNETGITYGNDMVFSTNSLPVVDAGVSDTIEYLEQVQLQGSCLSGLLPYQYLWSPPYNLSNLNIPNPLAGPLVSTWYTLWVVDGNGCLGSDSVLIVVDSPTDTISGTVSYDNLPETPMNNTIVYLRDQNGNLLSTTTTDINGFYSFEDLAAGQYQLRASTTKPWGGANATDALIILRHFTGMVQLTGLPLLAANVTTDNFVNSVDALVVSRRFIQLITSFPAGEWVFSSPNITVTGTGTNHIVEMKALCYGDVNQSHVPAMFKTEPSVRLINEGRLMARVNESILLPLTLDSELELGAFSLVLDYSAESVEVQDVIAGGQIRGEISVNSIGNQLRIGWYSLNPCFTMTNEPLAYIRLKMKDKLKIDRELFKLGDESEFAGAMGEVLSGLMIKVPELSISDGNITLNTWPNPCMGKSKVQFMLPEEGKVSISLHNLLGAEKLLLLQDEMLADGLHEVGYDTRLLSPGLYLLKLTVISGDVAMEEYCKVMISR